MRTYLYVKKECLGKLKDYGFVYNPNHREYCANVPRYEYWDGGKREAKSEKPILAVYDDGYYNLKMLFKSTYYAYGIPSVVLKMINDGVVTAKDGE